MEPAHMAAGVVQRHIIVQTGIHTACTQAIGNCPEAKHPERMADGKSQKRNRSHGYANCSDPPGAQLIGQTVTH